MNCIASFFVISVWSTIGVALCIHAIFDSHERRQFSS
jgi:hypothetical protein